MPKILIADSVAEKGLRLLEAAEGLEVDVQTGQSEDALVAIIGVYDALMVRSATQVTAKIIRAGTKLRVIGRAGVGVDNIDVPAATEAGVVVMNAPFGNVRSAAEHAFAMLLAVARNIPQAARKMREGVWDKKNCTGVELEEKVLGIVGLGKVGAYIAGFGRAFGMTCLAFDPYVTPERAAEMGVEKAELDDLVSRSDFITIHTPLTDETRHLFGGERLARMKPSAYLIQCARGGIVDEEALAEALRSKRIAGAALDVFSKEPLGESPLREFDNCVLTPHLGASTAEAQVRVCTDLADQFIQFFHGGKVINAVNDVAPKK